MLIFSGVKLRAAGKKSTVKAPLSPWGLFNFRPQDLGPIIEEGLMESEGAQQSLYGNLARVWPLASISSTCSCCLPVGISFLNEPVHSL